MVVEIDGDESIAESDESNVFVASMTTSLAEIISDLGDGSVVEIAADASFPTADYLIIQPDVSVQFTGDWSVLDPVVIDGNFLHRAMSADRQIHIRTQSPWTNPILLVDVDRNGSVTPRDALVVINRISRFAVDDNNRLGIPVGDQSHQYYDTNGDGLASPIDALTVINFIGRRSEQSEAESERIDAIDHLLSASMTDRIEHERDLAIELQDDLFRLF